MRKKSPKQTESDNLFIKKREADQKWDKLIESLKRGEKLSRFFIAQTMNECNWADHALMQRGLLFRH